jgi:hypothetical protein
VSAFASFVAELRATPCLAHMADDIAKAHRALEIEAGTNPDAWKFLKMENWILSQPRSLAEKLEQIEKLASLPDGPRIVRMKQLTGW